MEAAVRSGTMVYKLLTSHPSLSIFTWITISTGFSEFSTSRRSRVFASVSEPFCFEWITIVLFLYFPSRNSSDLTKVSAHAACSVSLQTTSIKGLTRRALLFSAYTCNFLLVFSWQVIPSKSIILSSCSSPKL